QVFTNRDLVHIEGTVRDQSAVTLRADGEKLSMDVGGAFTLPFALPEDRSYTIKLSATDAAGHETRKGRAITRGSTRPTLSWTGPDEAQRVPPGDVTVSGSVVSPLQAVKVKVNDQDARVVGKAWSCTVKLGSGKRLGVSVTATDPAGNVAEALTRTLVGDA